MRATEQEISSIQEEMTSNQAQQERCQKEQEELSGLLEDTKQEASRADAEEAELNAKSSLFERRASFPRELRSFQSFKRPQILHALSLPGSRQPLTMPRWNSPGFRRNTTPGKPHG